MDFNRNFYLKMITRLAHLESLSNGSKKLFIAATGEWIVSHDNKLVKNAKFNSMSASSDIASCAKNDIVGTVLLILLKEIIDDNFDLVNNIWEMCICGRDEAEDEKCKWHKMEDKIITFDDENKHLIKIIDDVVIKTGEFRWNKLYKNDVVKNNENKQLLQKITNLTKLEFVKCNWYRIRQHFIIYKDNITNDHMDMFINILSKSHLWENINISNADEPISMGQNGYVIWYKETKYINTWDINRIRETIINL